MLLLVGCCCCWVLVLVVLLHKACRTNERTAREHNGVMPRAGQQPDNSCRYSMLAALAFDS